MALIDNSNKFKAGDLLQSGNYPNYYLFVDAVNSISYKVCHVFKYESNTLSQYSKNTGHNCWMTFKEIEVGISTSYGAFNKVGYLPALIGNKYVRIEK